MTYCPAEGVTKYARAWVKRLGVPGLGAASYVARGSSADEAMSRRSFVVRYQACACARGPYCKGQCQYVIVNIFPGLGCLLNRLGHPC